MNLLERLKSEGVILRHIAEMTGTTNSGLTHRITRNRNGLTKADKDAIAKALRDMAESLKRLASELENEGNY